MAANGIDNLLTQLGLLTGTRAWGLEGKGSDYDYAVPEDLFHTVVSALRGEGVELESGSSIFNSIRFYTGGREYNVWPVPNDSMEAWRTITNLMKEFMLLPELRSKMAIKEHRVVMFTALRKIYGAKDSNNCKPVDFAKMNDADFNEYRVGGQS